MFRGKTVVIAVTGGIGAFKSAQLVREFRAAGAATFVIMTPNATEFITPLTLETLSGNPVAIDMFDPKNKWDMEHIALADRADLLIVAPATGNIIGKAAGGIADCLVSTTIMTVMSCVPILMAPAMNNRMWENPMVQRNVAILRDAGVMFAGPVEGKLADGRSGMGRLADISDILTAAEPLLAE